MRLRVENIQKYLPHCISACSILLLLRLPAHLRALVLYALLDLSTSSLAEKTIMVRVRAREIVGEEE